MKIINFIINKTIARSEKQMTSQRRFYFFPSASTSLRSVSLPFLAASFEPVAATSTNRRSYLPSSLLAKGLFAHAYVQFKHWPSTMAMVMVTLTHARR